MSQVNLKENLAVPPAARPSRRRRRAPRQEVARTRRPRRRQRKPQRGVGWVTRMGRVAISEVEGLPEFHTMPKYAADWLRKYIDPCGELSQTSMNMRVPDGAANNSALLGLREALTITPPPMPDQTDPTQQITLDGKLWTLTVFALPFFRNPYLLVAHMDASVMDDSDRAKLLSEWNSAIDPPVFPAWQQYDGAAIKYWCVLNWKVLRTTLPPNARTGEMGEIQQFRISAWGTTMYFNTPKIVDQGMVAASQWPLSSGTRNAPPFPSVYLHIHNYSQLLGPPAQGFGALNSVDLTIPSVVQDAERGAQWVFMSQGTYTVQISNAEQTRENPFVFPRYFTTALSVNAVNTFKNQYEMQFTDEDDVVTLIPPESTFTFTLVKTSVADGPVVYTVSLSVLVGTETTAIITSQVYEVGTRYELQLTRVTGTEGSAVEQRAEQQVNTFQLPPSDMEGIVQSNTKYLYGQLRMTKGVYVPSRIFQPVFNMQSASEARPTCMVGGDNPIEATGPVDTFDRNMGVATIIFNGISRACCPGIKCIRDVETISGDGSLIQVMMANEDEECENAILLIKRITKKYPMAFGADWNCLGWLGNAVSNILSKIPIANQALPIINGFLDKIIPGFSNAGGGQIPIQNESAQDVLANILKYLQRLAEMAPTKSRAIK